MVQDFLHAARGYVIPIRNAVHVGVSQQSCILGTPRIYLDYKSLVANDVMSYRHHFG